ncbi:DNA alkylation repair protein [Chondromyces apiculatus]|uniref:DNA alkylation repair protein n=1 Tax=Chondromyces apiculatus DSM 436 TaxID=1192034 RepID=A0A017SW16_9BACT|nr:DNA alkylation repair protein [Chondromyces apiculatus]EYF01173.1 Hypothetical protein CAP_8596 [Chondromyces apiculatus DSM 436]
MNLDDLMAELEGLGTEQNRKIYKRHGSGDNVFGVSFAHLGAIKKRIKTDHLLARKLWSTGNADARALATMIADPAQSSLQEADSWLVGVRQHGLIDMYTKDVVSRAAYAREAMERWTASEDEFIGRAGWDVLGQLAASDPSLPESLFSSRIQEIEARIGTAKNRTRETMNQALIRIGTRTPALRVQALAAARRIGKVEVDHGDTACKTSDAVATIEKIWARTGEGTSAPQAAGTKKAAKTTSKKKASTPAKAAVTRKAAGTKVASATSKKTGASPRPTRKP